MKVIFLLLCSFNILLAQSGIEILKKIQSKFNSISDFSANFIQYDCSNKNSFILKGKFYYKRTDKFIVELDNQTIISNGKTFWNYNRKQKQLIISNLSDEPTTYSLEKIIYNYPALCSIKFLKRDNDTDVIELQSKEGMLDLKNIKIWKDKNDMISKLEITFIDDVCYVMVFNNILTNQNYPDSKFIFNPPKGIRIVDLR